MGVSAPRWPCCGQGCRRRLSSLRTEHRWAIGALGCCGSRAYFLPSPHPTRSGAPRGVGTEPPWWAERVGGERGCPRTAVAFGGALGCVQWGWGAAAPGLRVWREGGPSVGLYGVAAVGRTLSAALAHVGWSRGSSHWVSHSSSRWGSPFLFALGYPMAPLIGFPIPLCFRLSHGSSLGFPFLFVLGYPMAPHWVSHSSLF